MESNTLPWPAVRDNAVAAGLAALEVAAVLAGRAHLAAPALDQVLRVHPEREQYHPCLLQRQHRRLRRSFHASTCTCWTARL